MKIHRILLQVAVLGALLLSSAVLASAQETPKTPSEIPHREVTKLVVENNNFLDVHIYGMRNGYYRSLGTVTGLSKAELTIPESLTIPGADFEILADPIGSNLSYQTGPILLGTSREVDLTIQGDLALSSFMVK
jgi:hypothetical protein